MRSNKMNIITIGDYATLCQDKITYINKAFSKHDKKDKDANGNLLPKYTYDIIIHFDNQQVYTIVYSDENRRNEQFIKLSQYLEDKGKELFIEYFELDVPLDYTDNKYVGVNKEVVDKINNAHIKILDKCLK